MITNRNDLLKCNDSKIVVEVVAPGTFPDGDGAPLLLKANTVDASQEKHVPVIESIPEGMLVKIGSTPHPMLDAHFIEFVEVIDGSDVYRHYFKPGDAPETVFKLEYRPGMIVREYCNIHGLWQK